MSYRNESPEMAFLLFLFMIVAILVLFVLFDDEQDETTPPEATIQMEAVAPAATSTPLLESKQIVPEVSQQDFENENLAAAATPTVTPGAATVQSEDDDIDNLLTIMQLQSMNSLLNR